MNVIYAEYNIHNNSIYIAITAGYLLRITTIRLNMQMWIAVEDSLKVW